MMNKKVKAGCAICLFWVLASIFAWNFIAVALGKEVTQEKQIQRIESKLNEEVNKLNLFQSKEAQLLTHVADLEKQVGESKKETKSLRLIVRDVRERLDAEIKKLKELRPTLMRTELQIGEYLISLYKFSRRMNIHILASGEMLSGLQRNIKYISIVTKKDRLRLRALAERASACRDEIAKTKGAIGETKGVLKKERSRLVILEKSLKEKIRLLMKVHGEKEFYETSVEELETSVRNLKQASNPALKPNSDDVVPSLSFEGCKGRLPLPIRGKLINNPKKMGTVFSGAKGVVIQADADKAVRAVFKGKVAYSGQLKGYGEVVIVNHGGRFFTVSAHLSKREKRKGDQVKSGDILGWAAEDGPKKEASIYFEIRKADKKLNPVAWLKND